MTNLKYLTLPELKEAKAVCEKTIKYHADRVNGQQERVKWVDLYIHAAIRRLHE